MTRADDLADVLDGRKPAADAEGRALVSLAARLQALPIRSEPVAGWGALEARFDALLAGGASRRWYEGWIGAGRPRPLVQRMAAGALLVSVVGGAGGAAIGVTPLEAARSLGDGVSGFVRYVTFRGGDGPPGQLALDPTATPTPNATTPSPLTTTTPPVTTNATPTVTVTPGLPSATATTAATTQDLRTFPVLDAGSVVLRVEGELLVLVSAFPAAGWTATGDESDDANEVEVTFTNGGREVQFSAELEDGAVSTDISDSEDGDDG